MIVMMKKLGHKLSCLGVTDGKRWSHDWKPYSLTPGSLLLTFCTEDINSAIKEEEFLEIVMDMVVQVFTDSN